MTIMHPPAATVSSPRPDRLSLRMGRLLLAIMAALAVVCSSATAARATDEPVRSENSNLILEPGQSLDLGTVDAPCIVINQSGTYELRGYRDIPVALNALPGADIVLRLADGVSMGELEVHAFATEEGNLPHVSIVTERGAQVSMEGSEGAHAIDVVVYGNAGTGLSTADPIVVFDGEDGGGTLQAVTDSGSEGMPAIGLRTSSGFSPEAPMVAFAGGIIHARSENAPAVEVGVPCAMAGAIVKATNGSDSIPVVGSVDGDVDLSISGGRLDVRDSGRTTAEPVVGSMEGDVRLRVSGGCVRTSNARSTFAIGSVRGDVDILISGGTVDVGTGLVGKKDITGDADENVSVAVSGGSFTGFVTSKGGGEHAYAESGSGTAVYRTAIELEEVQVPIGLTSLDVSGVTFGTRDIMTSAIVAAQGKNGRGVVLWLPEHATVTGATDELGSIYTGEIHPTANIPEYSYGMLDLASNMTLNVNTDSGYDGAARVALGRTSVVVEEPVDPGEDGYVLIGLFDEPEGGTMIISPRYELVPNVAGWTYSNGAWMRRDAPYMLYAQWEHHYAVAFDANPPAGASTEPSGSMDDADFKVGEATELPACGYALPGYRFVGWNTEADGSGDGFADSDEAEFPVDAGEVVTLYAQWEPLTYEVVLEAGAGAGGPRRLTFTFDTTGYLTSEGFTAPTGATHAYWLDTLSGTRYTEYGSAFNLCTVNDDGSLSGHTLVAQWSSNQIALFITRDGHAIEIDDPARDISLIPQDGGAAVTGFARDEDDAGTYVLDGVEPGTYGVDIDAVDADGMKFPTRGVTVSVANGERSVVPIEYVTVSIDAEGDGASVWLGSAGITKRVVQRGSKVAIGCAIAEDEGYSFDVWSICGGVNDLDSDLLEQTVTVEGTVEITACSRPAAYTVAFDANGGEGWMRAQDMVCHEEQKLDRCGFWRQGFVFTGWNTEPDGSGTAYGEHAAVRDLTFEDGATVTLYAQWLGRYTVAFDANAPEDLGALVTGEMDGCYPFEGDEFSLPPCGYALAGYTFTGWNTEPGGTGVAYADGETVRDLTDEPGAVVTLYAQWREGVGPGVEGPTGPDEPGGSENPGGGDGPGDSGGTSTPESGAPGAPSDPSAHQTSSTDTRRRKEGALAATGDTAMLPVAVLATAALAAIVAGLWLRAIGRRRI